MASCLANSLFSPKNLFDWGGFGKSKTDNKKPEPKYHDVQLPFPPSLVSKTFLKGILS